METSIFGDIIDYSDMTQSKKKCKKNDYTEAKIIGTAGSVEKFLKVIFYLKRNREEEEKRKKNAKSESTTDDPEVVFLQKEHKFLKQFAFRDLIVLPPKYNVCKYISFKRLTKNLNELENKMYLGISSGFTVFYRGQGDVNWSLVPGIYRDEEDWLVKCESQIFSDTISDFPEEFSNCETPLEQLVKMQHYSVPTRLLDVTTNPLVALFFACQKSEKHSSNDAVVYVIKVPNRIIKYGDSDSVTILSTLAKYDHYWDENRFRKHTKPVPGYFTGLRFLHAVRETKPWFRSKIRTKTLCSVFCVKPKHANPRIIRQSGAFLLFGIDRDKGRDQPASLKESGIDVERVLIPQAVKETISNELEALNISRASLFGDLDYYAEHIKDKYKEKQRNARDMKKES